MRPLLLAFVWLLTGAAQVLTPAPGICVDKITGQPQGGIATGVPSATPLVRTCDGSWRAPALRDGRLVLSDASALVSPERPDDSLLLPDGEVTTGSNRFAAGWLIGPTEIYPHGVLGDRTEASGLRVRLADGTHRELFLGSESVFEDLRARLVDLTGDGLDEIVVIRSRLDSGAALAVYGPAPGGLTLLGESPSIGLPNRWLNPAGVADFDRDGAPEIALVETPHIGGILKVFALRDGALALEASAAGFSNHAIGSRTLDLSAVIDWDQDGKPDLALPDARRRTMKVVTVEEGQVVPLAAQLHHREIVTAVLTVDLDRDGRSELLYGLEGGGLVLLRP